MKRESRILYVYADRRVSEELFVFVVFRGLTGIEFLEILREENLFRALKRFSERRIFREIRYYTLGGDMALSREMLEELDDLFRKNNISEISREYLERHGIVDLDFDKVLQRLLELCREKKLYKS
ncbi:MAG: hypothetical protein ABWJ42_02530 [Sulfolobales archaeon]